MAAIDQKPSALSVFSKGLLIENPTLRQMLGLCPTLAVTTAVTNGIGMGVATTFVLVCSGIVVSLLRNIIPTTMRLPAFITVIAGFVTIVMMVVEAYLPDLNQALGIYLPLIVVNCIVLGRAEVFASKHPVKDAALDGLGMGAGFTLTLVLMSAIRELLGAGTLLGFPILLGIVEPMTVFIMPPGGFAVLQRIAGCPEDDIMAAYLATNEANAETTAHETAQLSQGMSDDERAVLASFLEARPTYLRAFFDEVEGCVGGFPAYVRDALRLTPVQVASLRALLAR